MPEAMDTPGEHEPLLDRVDLLLKRHKQPLRSPDDDVPVLTEVVTAHDAATPPDPAALDALVERVSEAILRQVEASMDVQLTARIEQRIAALVATEISTTRAELLSVLRESLPATIADVLAERPNESRDRPAR